MDLCNNIFYLFVHRGNNIFGRDRGIAALSLSFYLVVVYFYFAFNLAIIGRNNNKLWEVLFRAEMLKRGILETHFNIKCSVLNENSNYFPAK